MEEKIVSSLLGLQHYLSMSRAVKHWTKDTLDNIISTFLGRRKVFIKESTRVVLPHWWEVAHVIGHTNVWRDRSWVWMSSSNRVHHKNSIDKLLAICCIGILPFGINLHKGGAAYKILLDWWGGKVVAQKNSYKCVYYDNGTYGYPKWPTNLLHKKGEKYFEN